MTLALFDTHVLLWAAQGSDRLPAGAIDLLADPDTVPHFSAASIWEVAIKSALGRADFAVDARALAVALRSAGYVELPVTSASAAAVADLPALHGDPFDRILAAQAATEDVVLVTHDRMVARYPRTRLV